MTFDVKNETIGHLYGTSIFRCNFFFLQSFPKIFQLYNVDQKRILIMISFVCTWTIQHAMSDLILPCEDIE